MATMTARKRAEPIEQTLQRAAVYDLLARALAYPDAATFASLLETATVAGPLLAGTPAGEVLRLLDSVTREELETSHVRVFTVSCSPDCPTFETAFLSNDPAQQTGRMADIAGFYRAFGVDPAVPGFRPDDISVELEFMGYLCRKQVHATDHLGAPRVGQVRRAQRMFLEEHLGRWGAPLGRRIAYRAPAERFYFTVGEALADWLDAECERLGTGPIDQVDAPQMTWEEPGSANDLLEDDDAELIAFDDIPVE
jgi:TorA maturation chaperone TorD